MRATLAIYNGLHNDALNRLNGLMKNELPVEKAVPTKEIAKIPSRINHWSGWVSQISFVLGVVVGMILFFGVHLTTFQLGMVCICAGFWAH